MIFKLYTIRDEIADENAPLFCAKNDAVAHRSFKNMLNEVNDIDKDTYKLFNVGSFDSDQMFVIESNPYEVKIDINMEDENA